MRNENQLLTKSDLQEFQTEMKDSIDEMTERMIKRFNRTMYQCVAYMIFMIGIMLYLTDFLN